MRLLLVGNYGVGNLGDEALRSYFIRTFPEVTWTVVSTHPEAFEVPRLPLGIRSFLGTRWWRTLRAYVRTDGLVFGGGSLFTDIESPKACVLWWLHAFVAWVLRKKIFLAFQGFGPFHTRVGEWCARWTVKHAFFLSVRDELSLERVQSWNMNKKVILSFDPVFTMLSETSSKDSTKNVLIIIPRQNSSELFFKRVENLRDSRPWDEMRIVSMEPEAPGERLRLRQLQKLTGGTLWEVHALSELSDAVRGGTLMLTQRYHGGIAALALGVKFETVSQGVEDKLHSLSGVSSMEAKVAVEAGERELQRLFGSARIAAL